MSICMSVTKHDMTFTFDLLQGQICCCAGDPNSPDFLLYVDLYIVVI